MATIAEEFDAFWASYPRRTGKLDAVRAYAKARRIDSAENILAGVERYKRNKPEYADWCHPSTFLNKGRWMDEDDAPVVVERKVWTCPHTPACSATYKEFCLTRQWRDSQRESA
jgi:hypothetical protein